MFVLNRARLPSLSMQPGLRTINLCFTTIPSRLNSTDGFDHIVQAVRSLVRQVQHGYKLHAFLSVPQSNSAREGVGYPRHAISKLEYLLNGSLTIVNVSEDAGPATRYIGCWRALRHKPQELILAADDDQVYRNGTLATLLCAKHYDSTFSWSGWRYRYFRAGIHIGQAADALLLSVGDLSGFEDLLATVGQECFRVDDLAISWHLSGIGKPVKSLTEHQQHHNCGFPPTPVYINTRWEASNRLQWDETTGGRELDTIRCTRALWRRWFLPWPLVFLMVVTLGAVLRWKSTLASCAKVS